MNVAYSILLILLLGLSLGYVFWPWIYRIASDGKNIETNDLGEYPTKIYERENLFESLKDLELDFQTLKLSKEDYDEMRADLMNKLGKILEEIDAIEHSHPTLREILRDLKDLDLHTKGEAR